MSGDVNEAAQPRNGATAATPSVDQQNDEFWSELCGSQLAREIGVTDDSRESLRRFDEWYMAFYPYLDRHVRFDMVAGKDVLEVGLGYCTVAQRLAASGARFAGLDIAAGPVRMMRHRLGQLGIDGDVRQGSILECPFAENSFDVVIAIGCYHHTGNLQRALDETLRILRPGGRAMVMVYNAYSYRRWLRWPGSTLRYALWDKIGIGLAPSAADEERAAYDVDSAGAAAPETVFVSAAHIKRMCAKWRACEVYRENIAADWFLGRFDRALLNRLFGSWLGLDLYCHLTK